jgi:Tfp pilus assembly protein PilF
MRFVLMGLALICAMTAAFAQQKTEGLTDEKAQKTLERASQSLKEHRMELALDDFKKADRQDGDRCIACQKQMIKYGMEFWKAAELGAEEMTAEVHGEKEMAIAQYRYAVVLMAEGLQRQKDEYFSRAHEECGHAPANYVNFPDVVLEDGIALAHMGQDGEVKARFEQYVKMRPDDDANRQRASIHRPPGTCPSTHGAPFHGNYGRWTQSIVGRPSGDGCAAGFLGHVVRAMPRSSAPYS